MHTNTPATPQTPATRPSEDGTVRPSQQPTPYQRALRWLDKHDDNMKGEK